MSNLAVKYSISRPETSNRILALLGLPVPGIILFSVFSGMNTNILNLSIKHVLLLPHYIILIFLWVAQIIAVYIAGWMVSITGEYPNLLFRFSLRVLARTERTDAWLYSLTDKYPPLGFAASGYPDYPLQISVDHPKNPSRLLALGVVLLFIPKIIMLIPHIILLVPLAFVLWPVAVFGYIVILFKGTYPESLFGLVVLIKRWYLNTSAYMIGWTDEYPTFNIRTYLEG